MTARMPKQETKKRRPVQDRAGLFFCFFEIGLRDGGLAVFDFYYGV